MNSLIKFCVLIFYFSISTSAQNFFPTDVGDSYQIYCHFEVDGPGYPPHSGEYWINGPIEHDTIIEGKHFVRVNHPALKNRYYHYDESENKLMIRTDSNVTRLAVDFNAANGDTFISYIDDYNFPKPYKSLGTSTLNFHGVIIPVYSCKNLNYSMYNEEYRFGKDVGLIYAYLNTDYVTSGYNRRWFNIRAAIVDSIVYGEIHLQIDSLSPIQNRPVNLFPFTLTGYYTSDLNMGGYNAGEDMVSLYLDLIHMRGGDTLGVYNYDFDSINVLIPFIPQEGDKIYFKAIASDTTIFNNVDEYPNEGYIEMTVLPPVVNVNDYTSPSFFLLNQNYPNPFNPSTIIKYSVASATFVTLTIYDVMGNEISKVINELKQSGFHKYEFDGSGLTSGVYFYRITAGDKTDMKKMMFLK